MRKAVSWRRLNASIKEYWSASLCFSASHDLVNKADGYGVPCDGLFRCIDDAKIRVIWKQFPRWWGACWTLRAILRYLPFLQTLQISYFLLRLVVDLPAVLRVPGSGIIVVTVDLRERRKNSGRCWLWMKRGIDSECNRVVCSSLVLVPTFTKGQKNIDISQTFWLSPTNSLIHICMPTTRNLWLSTPSKYQFPSLGALTSYWGRQCFYYLLTGRIERCLEARSTTTWCQAFHISCISGRRGILCSVCDWSLLNMIRLNSDKR